MSDQYDPYAPPPPLPMPEPYAPPQPMPAAEVLTAQEQLVSTEPVPALAGG